MVPSTLTTSGPRASSLTVVPEPLTSRVVTLSPSWEPGAGRASRGDGFDEDELSWESELILRNGDEDENGEMRWRGLMVRSDERRGKVLRRSIGFRDLKSRNI